MKLHIQIPVEHGLLFLSDPYNDDLAPSDTGADLVTSTKSCLAFQVLSYIDGEADVTISNKPGLSAGKNPFTGSISTPSGIVSLSDSRRFNYCFLPVENRLALVDVWYYGEHNEKTWITVSNIEEF